LTDNTVYALAVSGGNLFAGTERGGVLLSTDNGTSWTQSGLTNTNVGALAVSGTNLFAGTSPNGGGSGGGVFLSTNNGTSWTAVNTGLTNTSVSSLAVSDSNLFAGTSGGGVWTRPLSEMITDVESEEPLPSKFTLAQNYPNPFNPSTTIRYGLPQRSQVTLSVFNTLGEQVALLQNGEQEAGYHEIKFDAKNLSSGVYFYRIQAEDFVQTKRLLLLK